MSNKIITAPPYPSGGGGGGSSSGGSGGGNPAAGKSINVPASNGGVFAQRQVALFPCFSIANNRTEYHAFDPAMGFNDPLAASSYSWRYEQVKPYRQATVRRLLLTYRDLGRVSVTFTITGSTDNGTVVSNSTPIGFGSSTPTNRLLTTPVDIQLTALNPQLSVRREADAGPLSIVQVVMVGMVETNTL